MTAFGHSVGLIAFDWRGTGAKRQFFLIKKAILEDEESEKAQTHPSIARN